MPFKSLCKLVKHGNEIASVAFGPFQANSLGFHVVTCRIFYFSNSMKLVFKVAVLFLFCACTKKEVKYIPYYSFDEIGQSLLSELHVNDTLKFKKANGQIRTYVVLNIEKRKEDVTDCDWIGDHCETFYFYDHLIYQFLRTDNLSIVPDSLFEFTRLDMQMQLPQGTDKENLTPNIQAKAVIYGKSFVDYNIIPSSAFTAGYINFPDFYEPLNTFVYSNATRTYEDVILIQSGNHQIYTDPYSNSIFTVHEIWWDKKHGIVSFKDVNNNIWERIN